MEFHKCVSRKLVSKLCDFLIIGFNRKFNWPCTRIIAFVREDLSNLQSISACMGTVRPYSVFEGWTNPNDFIWFDRIYLTSKLYEISKIVYRLRSALATSTTRFNASKVRWHVYTFGQTNFGWYKLQW